MARPRTIDDELLFERLTEVFQTYGYEGANLGRISDATGLKRASLYHRFPGGKTAMAEAVLDRAAQRVIDEVTAPLRSSKTPRERLAGMAREVDRFYTGGKFSCLLDSMSFGGAGKSLELRVEGALEAWIAAMVVVFHDAGLADKEARARSVDAMIRIQGSLVYARATKDTKPFQRALATLPDLVDESGGSRDGS